MLCLVTIKNDKINPYAIYFIDKNVVPSYISASPRALFQNGE